ncbi:RHS repeat protein, partial [Xanthomonas vasicola]
MTKSIAGVWSSCLTGASSDTGWGFRDYYDVCKDDYYKYSRAFNWLVIRECRKLTYQTRTCQYPDSDPWDYTFIAIKSRDATCPDGYSLDNGTCFLAEPTEECKIGDAEPREKSLHLSQNDYSSNDDLLNFDRVWNKSGNQYTPASAAQASSNRSGMFFSANSAQATTEVKSSSNIGMGWRHNYDIRLFEIKGSTNAVAAIYFPDGKMRIYRSSGESLEIRNEPPTTLTKKINPDGSSTWIRRNEKNQLETFGEDGRLNRITALDGRFVSLSYNVQGQLESVTARSGRGLKITYNEDGLISNIEQPDGTALQYYYTNGNLVKVLKNDGTSVSYRYDSASGTLQDILDESGSIYQHFDYDNSGRLKRSSKGWALGGTGVQSYDYGYVQDKWGYSIDAVTMPNGSTISFNYQFSGGIRRVLSTDGSCATCNSSAQNTYDSIGRLTSKVDQKGTQTSYKYDAAGNKSEIIYASNSGSFSQKIQTDWLAEYNLPTQRRYYDAAGSVVKSVEWDYGNDGQINSHSIRDGKDSRISRFEYCTATDVSSGSCPFIGLLKSADGTRTDVQDRQTYSYYSSDDAACNSPSTCLHRKGDLREVVDNLGRTTQYLTYDGAGRPLSIKDANGIVTDYTYHPRGWLTATKVRGADASSEADDRITRIDYWPTGLVKQVTQPDGAFTAFTYDAA